MAVVISDVMKMMESESFFLDTSKYKAKDFQKIADFINNLEKENPFRELSFCFDGEPKPAPRPRVGTLRIGKGENQQTITRWYDPGSGDKVKIRKYVQSLLGKDYDPIDAEVMIEIKTFKPMIKDFNMTEKFLAEAGILRPDKKPDVDNYAKTVMDAINGVIWTDDSRVVKLTIEKFYSSYPRIETRILYRTERLTKK